MVISRTVRVPSPALQQKMLSLAKYGTSRGFNDFDMMEIGNGGLSAAEA